MISLEKQDNFHISIGETKVLFLENCLTSKLSFFFYLLRSFHICLVILPGHVGVDFVGP